MLKILAFRSCLQFSIIGKIILPYQKVLLTARYLDKAAWGVHKSGLTKFKSYLQVAALQLLVRLQGPNRAGDTTIESKLSPQMNNQCENLISL